MLVISQCKHVQMNLFAAQIESERNRAVDYSVSIAICLTARCKDMKQSDCPGGHPVQKFDSSVECCV